MLQFQWWNNSGTLTSVLSEADGDVLLKDWADNPVFIDSPLIDTTYGVSVRCSSDPTCTTQTDEAGASLLVTVDCPDGGTTVVGATAFGLDLTWNNKNQITWENTVLTVDLVRGDLYNLRSGGNLTTSIVGCAANDLTDATRNVGPANPGEAWYYLLRREVTFCNESAGSYGTKATSEQGWAPFSGSARDVGINASGSSCSATHP
mgnify:FL=1